MKYMRMSAVIAIFFLILLIVFYPLIAEGFSSIAGQLSKTGVFVVDTEPPQYVSSGQNQTEIDINDTIELNATFTDNVQLKRVILYLRNSTEDDWRLIRQYYLNYTETFGAQETTSSGDWIDFDEGVFVFRVNISSSGTYSWKIVSEDMAQNSNTTSVHAFSVLEPSSDDDSDDSSAPAPSSSGGGGGTTIISDSSDISLGVEVVTIKLLQGTTTSRVLQITNEGSNTEKFSFSKDDPYGIISFSRDSATLEPEESVFITVDIQVSGKMRPETYLSDFIIEDEKGNSEKVLFVISVSLAEGLFDINFDIEDNLVKAGENLSTTINFINFGESAMDVSFYYEILDLEKEIIEMNTETFAVFEEVTLEKDIPIPEDIESGRYILIMGIMYEGGKQAYSSDLFEVVEGSFAERGFLRTVSFMFREGYVYQAIMIFIAFMIFAAVFYFQLRKDKQINSGATSADSEDDFQSKVSRRIKKMRYYLKLKHRIKNK